MIPSIFSILEDFLLWESRRTPRRLKFIPWEYFCFIFCIRFAFIFFETMFIKMTITMLVTSSSIWMLVTESCSNWKGCWWRNRQNMPSKSKNFHQRYYWLCRLYIMLYCLTHAFQLRIQLQRFYNLKMRWTNFSWNRSYREKIALFLSLCPPLRVFARHDVLSRSAWDEIKINIFKYLI